MNREERLNHVSELTSRLLDGVLSTEGRAVLNELLRGDPETCERYLDLAEAHALLLREHDGDALQEEIEGILPFLTEATPSLKVFGSPRRLWPTFLAAAATLALLLVGASLWKRSAPVSESVDLSYELSHAEGVAVLSRLVDAEWDGPGFEEGATIPGGVFQMRSGLAQLEFFSGATLIVEGPVELDLVSAWRLVCRRGKLRAFVPEPARGFAIGTPEYEAVDLGTEFALGVAPDGRCEVHVVDGEVRLDDGEGREIRTLLAGDGFLAADGVFESVGGGGADFVDRRQLLSLANADSRTRYEEWLKAREAITQDEATLVLFDFEDQEPWDRQLLNRHSGGPKAAIIGAKWTEGRWPGKGALEFKRITDRARLHVPGTFDALSFAAWVRIEGFERWLSSLFLTDGFDRGEVHWQISNLGELILGISDGGPPNTVSPPVIYPGDLGKWLHLAVTVDREGGRVVHYRNGEAVMQAERSGIPPLVIGGAEIGNWRAHENGNPIRSLNGRIDEFVILGRVLSPDEVASIHRAGMPSG